MKQNRWPTLDYSQWKDTYQTLHRWLQIVGKVRMCKFPWMNHSWHTSLFVTSRGLSTMAIPDHDGNVSVEFDFIDHVLIIQTSRGDKVKLPLHAESVSSFYLRFIQVLEDLDIQTNFYPHPNEVEDNTHFAQDESHCSYDPTQANQFWQILVRVNNLMNDFRSNFLGKSSPVHFFWGSFDLAVTRFSGAKAPEHPAGIPHLPEVVAKEAYSHEVSSCGFWPGNEMYPHAAFYSYAYPEPEKFSDAQIKPFQAFYHNELRQFVLPYDEVIKMENPAEAVMVFFESTYNAAASLGRWDRKELEESQFLSVLKQSQASLVTPQF